MVAVIFFLVSCDKLLGGSLSGNIKFTYRSYYLPITGEQEFKTLVLSGIEVTLLKYDDTLIQKDKELREECSPKITTASKRCTQEHAELQKTSMMMGKSSPSFNCDEVKTIMQNCINNRNNNALSFTVQKTTTDANGTFVFPSKISYGKYILLATYGVHWWLVPLEINQSQTNLDLTEENAFMLNLN
jgi:hypothetical protein